MGTPPYPAFEATFARNLPGMSEPWSADIAPAPRLVALNDDLARSLGFDPDWLRSDDGLRFLCGNIVPAGAMPVAQAYSGHQFGSFSPRLGDGRAMLLGEIVDAEGARCDLHFKGTGRTTFSRGADGKAALGPMLREYVIGEAMHALGIPTTRALAVVATGEMVRRQTGTEPGAVLSRVASSHLRVGSFEWAAGLGLESVRRLVEYTIDRHDPALATHDVPALALLDAVARRQARLVASWMHVGFIHGVMNTDNMTISGETIDYGPCAFMDAFDPRTVYSSIDSTGRYAFGNQPHIARWNLARFAETLVPLIAEHGGGTEEAVRLASDILEGFGDRFETEWMRGMRVKTGLPGGDLPAGQGAGDHVIADLLPRMAAQRVDHTNTLRALSALVRGDRDRGRQPWPDPAPFDEWTTTWRRAREGAMSDDAAVADGMDAVNPAYIPRNHLVELALVAAVAGDMNPFDELMSVLAEPYTERPGLEAYAEPMPADWEGYQTFCGT